MFEDTCGDSRVDLLLVLSSFTCQNTRALSPLNGLAVIQGGTTILISGSSSCRGTRFLDLVKKE